MASSGKAARRVSEKYGWKSNKPSGFPIASFEAFWTVREVSKR
jgi:hypothetical protein